MVLKTKSCEGSKGKQPQGTISRNFQASTESSLAMIMDKLEKLATSIDEKTVNQTVFVKVLRKTLHETKAQNEYLAAKVKVLETEPATDKTWYANENAHNMYVNQAKGTSAHLWRKWR